MSESKEGFEEEVIKGVEKQVSGYIDSKEHDGDIKKEFESDEEFKSGKSFTELVQKEFKGASFNADFVITKESMDEMLAMKSKVQVFKDVVRNALKRVEHDLVDEMKLKDPETFISDISNDMIDNFLKHGLKIVITGKIVTEEERKEFETFKFGGK